MSGTSLEIRNRREIERWCTYENIHRAREMVYITYNRGVTCVAAPLTRDRMLALRSSSSSSSLSASAATRVEQQHPISTA